MTEPHAAHVSAWPWTSRRRLVVGLCVLATAACVGFGGWAWCASTQPSDPLVVSAGLGFEGPGRTGVRVGQPIAFVAWLLTRSPVTVTGYEATQPKAMTVRVVGITGPPPSRQALSIVGRPRPGQPGEVVIRSRIVPVVGRRSVQAPPALRTHLSRYLLTIAIVATARQPGCHRLGRVTVAYRVGTTTFHRSALPEAGFISTSKRSCFGAAATSTGVYRSP
jgi:hypothetical protein